MMNNDRIASVFDEMADLLELSGENAFRVRAYRNGAAAIRDLEESVVTILDDDSRKLTDVEGVGKTLAEKCETLVRSGVLPAYEKLKEKIPVSLLQVMRIPGVGAKKAAVLFRELNVTDLNSLKTACESNAVQALKGFGAKTQQGMLDGIAIAEQANQRIRIDQADLLVDELRQWMKECPSIQKIEFTGSYRRRKETVGDLDLLVVSENSNEVMDRFADFPARTETIVRGGTKMSIRVDRSFQVDLRVVPDSSWGAALQYFTGSKEHNVRIRSRAKQMYLKVNEYGVFKTNDDSYVAGALEEDVYAAVGLPWVPPELRETRIDLDSSPCELPKLIELSDICGDLHMHTTESDGEATIEQMVAAAKVRGLSYIAITDHSKRVSMANGLNEERLLAQWRMIDELNQRENGEFLILKGIECDILEAGGMDLSNTCLEQADWVLASVHYGQKQSRQQITDRIIGAVENPCVSAIAHPTGRILGRRQPYEVDMDAVMQAVVANKKILELNASPYRLDLSDTHCANAQRLGIPIVINTDAHSVSGMDVMRYGVMQARRAALQSVDVLNCLDSNAFTSKISAIR